MFQDVNVLERKILEEFMGRLRWECMEIMELETLTKNEDTVTYIKSLKINLLRQFSQSANRIEETRIQKLDSWWRDTSSRKKRKTEETLAARHGRLSYLPCM